MGIGGCALEVVKAGVDEARSWRRQPEEDPWGDFGWGRRGGGTGVHRRRVAVAVRSGVFCGGITIHK
jgi:hypothetical protein